LLTWKVSAVTVLHIQSLHFDQPPRELKAVLISHSHNISFSTELPYLMSTVVRLHTSLGQRQLGLIFHQGRLGLQHQQARRELASILLALPCNNPRCRRAESLGYFATRRLVSAQRVTAKDQKQLSRCCFLG